MQKIVALVLCSALILVAGDDATKSTVAPPVTTTVPTTPSTTTFAPSTEKTTTSTAPPTSEKSTTASTTTSTTVIPTLPTTTSAPTSPPTTPTTTYPPTTSTTTPVPSTTSIPEPTFGKWAVSGTNNGTSYNCILLQMEAELNIKYNDTLKNSTFANVFVPANAMASGSCTGEDETMTLSWKSMGMKNDSLTFHFMRNVTSKHYSLHHVEVEVASEDLPKINTTAPIKYVLTKDQFSVNVGESYRCMRWQSFNLTQKGNDTPTVGVLKFAQFQFQAFRSDNSTLYGLASDCAMDVPDIVPIAVGCLLGSLVLIVLIAYLIGRRRNQAHGYLSM